jgi:hypothetical protein
MNQNPYTRISVHSSYLAALTYLLARKGDGYFEGYFTTSDEHQQIVRDDVQEILEALPSSGYTMHPLVHETLSFFAGGVYLEEILGVSITCGDAHGGNIIVRYTRAGDIVHFIAIE